MGTVYVVQDDGSKNFAPALGFGTLQSLMTKDYPKHDAGAAIRCGKDMRFALSQFNQDQDYLLLTGDPILIGKAMSILFESHDVIPCLKWDKQTRQYLIVNVYDNE